MNRALAIAAPVVAALSLSLAWPDRPTWTDDEKAVRGSIEDYVLAFYEAEPARLERALSRDMKKMGYWRAEGTTAYQGPAHMNYEQALELAAAWNKDGRQGELLPYEITLHEVVDKTACGKLVAEWGQDYFQLVKEEDRWRIHHVLWQSAPMAPADEPADGDR